GVVFLFCCPDRRARCLPRYVSPVWSPTSPYSDNRCCSLSLRASPHLGGVVGWTKLGRSATWRAQTQALYAPIRAQPCLARPANDHTPYGPYTDVCALTAQTSDTRRGLEPGTYRLYQEKISVFTGDVFRPLTTPAPGWGREPGRLYRHLLRDPSPSPGTHPSLARSLPPALYPQLRYINGFNADSGLPTQLSSRHMSYGRADDIGNMTIGTAMASGVEGMPVIILQFRPNRR
ncbi:hypothetical protein Bbelb_269660, partial [Branchiostoma belcheri]